MTIPLSVLSSSAKPKIYAEDHGQCVWRPKSCPLSNFICNFIILGRSSFLRALNSSLVEVEMVRFFFFGLRGLLCAGIDVILQSSMMREDSVPIFLSTGI